MIDNIRKVTGGKGSGCPCAKVFFLNWNHLDRMAGALVEVIRHGLLLCKPFRLIFGSPEPNGIGTCYTRSHHGHYG